jgi:hypothetical protein
VRATRELDDEEVVALGVRISSSPLVLPAFIQDTSVAGNDLADIQLSTPLPSGTIVYFRGYARTSQGTIVYSEPTGARIVPNWLVLLAPGPNSGAVLSDPSPEFVWSSSIINAPPGPWVYNWSVSRSADGATLLTRATSDTTFQLPFALEFNTSYRWEVTAVLQSPVAISVTRSLSFVVVDPAMPRATILHQTFPNPFPSGLRDNACVWFDVAQAAEVSLEVLDLRTNLVKRLFPQSGAPAQLPAGRYGRDAMSTTGCAPEFQWDGTDQRGRRVNAGVYLLRMRAGTRVFVQRMVFRG